MVYALHTYFLKRYLTINMSTTLHLVIRLNRCKDLQEQAFLVVSLKSDMLDKINFSQNLFSDDTFKRRHLLLTCGYFLIGICRRISSWTCQLEFLIKILNWKRCK